MKKLILIALALCGIVQGQTIYGGSGSVYGGNATESTVIVNPSGTADDVKIQDAIDSLPSEGGKVYLNTGAYVFKSNVEVPSNVILEAAIGSTFTVAADHTLDEDTVTKNTDEVAYMIRNENLDGSDTNIHIIGFDIDFGGGPDTSKYDEDKSYSAIWLDSCSDSSIEQCSTANVVYDLTSVAGRAIGILLSDCADSEVRKCHSEWCGYEGIGLRGNCDRCNVIDSTTASNKTHSIQVAAWAPTFVGNGRNCKIVRCSDVSNVAGNQMIFHGIVNMSRDMENCSIIDCEFETILLMEHLNGALVTGTDVGDLQIAPLTDGTLQNLNIVSNVFTKGSALTHERIYMSRSAIYTGTAVKNLNISNNTFRQTATISFTSGGTYEIKQGDTITGAISTDTAVIQTVYLDSGTWAGGDAAGKLTLLAQSGAFSAETLNVGANINVANIAGNSTTNGAILLSGGVTNAVTTLDNVNISNNLIDVSEMNNSNTILSIEIESFDGDYSNINIENNQFLTNIRSEGIRIKEGGSSTINDVRIAGNMGDQNAQHFITLSTGSINYVSIESNRWSTIAGQNWLQVTGPITYLAMKNNNVRTLDYVIKLTSGSIDQLLSTGNWLDYATGLYEGVPTNIVTDNDITIP